jgi:ferrous iron transport protein A
MNAVPPPDTFLQSLDRVALGTRAKVVAIQWASLADGEARRLRHLGFDTGAIVEPLHCGPFGRDPIAVRVGRMTVALRRSHARVISVQAE